MGEGCPIDRAAWRRRLIRFARCLRQLDRAVSMAIPKHRLVNQKSSWSEGLVTTEHVDPMNSAGMEKADDYP